MSGSMEEFGDQNETPAEAIDKTPEEVRNEHVRALLERNDLRGLLLNSVPGFTEEDLDAMNAYYKGENPAGEELARKFLAAMRKESGLLEKALGENGAHLISHAKKPRSLDYYDNRPDRGDNRRKKDASDTGPPYQGRFGKYK